MTTSFLKKENANIWAENPTPRHALWFGAAGGLAVLSKLSSLPFFAAAAGITPSSASTVLAADSTSSQQRDFFSSVQMRPIAGRV